MTTLVKLQVMMGNQIKSNQQIGGVTHYAALKATASITLLFYDTLGVFYYLFHLMLLNNL